MDLEETLQRIREAIACLDEAANYISIESGIARKLHARIQDASDGLVGVREEIQAGIVAADNLKKLLKGGRV
jgi:hypothetical protein